MLSVCSFLYVEQIATLPQMLPLAFLGALLGDHSGYYFGRWIGPRFHQTAFAKRHSSTIQKTEHRIRSFGNYAIIFGRLMTAVRSMVPVLVGISGMSKLKYSTYDVVACLVWTTGLGFLVIGIDSLWG